MSCIRLHGKDQRRCDGGGWGQELDAAFFSLKRDGARSARVYRGAVAALPPRKGRCCASGSGIQCLYDPWIQDLGGARIGRKSSSESVIQIRDEHPGSYFRELRQNFWVKILKFFDADPESFWPWIRDVYPGSATLISNIFLVKCPGRGQYEAV
jgi:hypothetical protein